MTIPVPDDDPEQEKVSIDQYARENGLTINSVLDPSCLIVTFSHMHKNFDPVEDDESLRPLQLPNSPCLHERPVISKASVEMLARTETRDDITTITSLVLIEAQKQSYSKKIQLPLLLSDPETDSINLQQTIHDKMVPEFKANLPPLEPLDASQDEALDFPLNAHIYHDEMLQLLGSECISISKTGIDHLKCALQDTLKSAETAMLSSKIGLSRPERAQEMSPPLSPIRSSPEHYIPDVEVSQVPISSDPSTLLDADIEAAAKAIMITFSSSSRPVTPKLSPIEDISIYMATSQRAESLMLKEPLMLSDSIETLEDDCIDIGQIVADLGTDHNHPHSVLGTQTEFSDTFSDDLLSNLREGVTKSNRSIEQERLNPIDTSQRLSVPIMDFSVPEPEWMSYKSDPIGHRKSMMKKYLTASFPNWREENKEYMQLQWIPFCSKLGRISLEETIDTPVPQSLLELGDDQALTSSNFVWKQPGLAILTDLDDDEILDIDPLSAMNKHVPLPSSLDQGEHIARLARKRKQGTTNTTSSGEASYPSVPTIPAKYNPAHDKMGHMLVGVDDPSASSTLLSNFVNFHNFKRRKPGRSLFFQHSSPSVVHLSEQENGSATIEAGLENLKREQEPTDSNSIFNLTPYPSLKEEGVPANIIASISLTRGVMLWLDRLLPHLRITERDFDRWNSISWDRKSVSRSPVMSPLAAEADVIVSPSTGIVITSLIKAIQRPLPGQKGKATIRQRIEEVSLRSERTIILVSEANRIDETARELTQSECIAFTDFSGFASGLDTNMQVYYIGGGEETLSRWLAYFITKYSHEARKVDHLIIDSESTWEIILRRAGMNAFGAQVILSTMKQPQGVFDGNTGHQGLAGFITMSPEDRIAKFGGLVGGHRVLRRVGSVLDSCWASP